MAQVYISSTFTDLEPYRQAVYRTLRQLGHDVIAMEDYVASPRRPLEDCLRDVGRCELYIGIFAWRYGFVPDVADPASPEAGNPERKSITELEYLHAAKEEKDRLIFLLGEDAPWPKALMEGGEAETRLKALRERLGKEHGVDFFKDLGELTTQVSTAVSVWQEQRRQQPAPPAATPEGEPEVNVARLPVTGRQLFGRDEQLRQLDEAWADPDTNVVSLVAWGGVGKSALVNHWRRSLAREDYRGARKVYAWSFYRQGTSDQGVSADQFIDAALRWFGDDKPNEGSPWEKGERLARLVKKQRTLLFLDGLEPLQYPPHSGLQTGALKEQSMQALLRELAANNPGLCVITTRLHVHDLADFEGETARLINLEHLSPEAGAEVLKAQGTTGEQAELERASAEFGGHALALMLLGSYLKNVYDGDINRRDKVDILKEDEERGGHAQRVMASYEKWFGDVSPELAVLRMIALFDRPADAASINALRNGPAIPNLTDALETLTDEDWRRTLSRLRTAKLIADKDLSQPDTLDAHPLVREYFKKHLKRHYFDAWREGNNRLYEHLKNTTKEFPDTIEEMTPLYAAVAHGCAAGRYQEAMDVVYYPRIHRRATAFSMKELGAFSAELGALTGFFDLPWRRPVSRLRERDKAFFLSTAGFVLRALGRLVEAIEPMQAGLEADIQQENWRGGAISANNLSELHLTLGNLSQALIYGQQSVELADKGGNPFDQFDHRTVLADALFQAGRLPEAEVYFREAEEMQKESQPQFPFFYSILGFRYNSVLLQQGKYQEVQTRADQTLEWAMRYGGLLDVGFDYLSLGRAYLLQARHEGTVDFLKATDYLNQALDILRQSGQSDYLARGLMARAELRRFKSEFERARVDLEEAMSIATRGSMGLNQADCHLEYARLYLAQEEKDKAREHLRKAKEMIGRMGYHLRDGEVRELEGLLGEKAEG